MRECGVSHQHSLQVVEKKGEGQEERGIKEEGEAENY